MWCFIPNHPGGGLSIGLFVMVFSGMKKRLVKVGMYNEDVRVKLNSGCNMGINHLINGPLVVL